MVEILYRILQDFLQSYSHGILPRILNGNNHNHKCEEDPPSYKEDPRSYSLHLFLHSAV